MEVREMKKLLLTTLIVSVALLAACSKKTDHDKTASANNESAEHGSHGDSHGEEENLRNTSAMWQFDHDNPQPDKDTSIKINIQDADGKAIRDFDINHEKKMHLIVVSKDLSFFNHIHPEYKGEGSFEIVSKFPNPGDYKLIADYIPSGGSATTQSEWITVSGTAPEPEEIAPAAELTTTVDGIGASLDFDHLMADRDVSLTFTLEDAKTKEPISDLQPYLGAVGHVVILSEDAERYLHVHPTDEDATGPKAEFMTKFPDSGVYKIWGQFQRNDKIYTIPFVVNVP
jgi:major membrane immunogen (membrane-anchored lipoprotein)